MKKVLNYDYDERADVLYISFPKPKRSICTQVESGPFVLRWDRAAWNKGRKKLTGITIVNFKQWLSKGAKIRDCLDGESFHQLGVLEKTKRGGLYAAHEVVSGQVPEDWLVGDHVTVEVRNISAEARRYPEAGNPIAHPKQS